MTRWLRGSAVALTRAYDAALVDLDGVVYVGLPAVPGAAEAIAAARAAGQAVVFVTNNASRTTEVVAAHLSDLGIPARPADVVGAADAVARLVAEAVPSGAAVLVTGGEGVRRAVAGTGLVLTDDADEAAAVVSGYTPETTYAQLAEATLAVRRGVPWFAANVDATLPTERGLVPGNGALVAVVATATGRYPVVAGKPGRALHDDATARAGATHPLVVGDRLDTDIAGANTVGCDSLLVLSGVTDVATLLAAGPGERPTYLAADLRGLLVPHPAATVEDGLGRCRDAVVRDETVERDAPGPDGLDVLRARLAVAWS